ncbi:MAG: TIGR03619 family F420-dependent LLM class oxidoreductase [Actinobacteria bacterium]|nr:TIGR03619 family F420-dependent LLM class oxidoreductase [Actinomycetota bacterium]
MQYCVSLQTDHVDMGDKFASGEGVAAVARAAEAAGFDAVFVTEHPFPEDEWMATGGHHALDPFVTLMAAAAATTRLRVLTNLCVVPYHNPYVLAKTALTVDVLSGGRLILGCGAGYLEAEFAAVGAAFTDRNDRFDAAIAAMKAAWTQDGVPVAASGSTHTMRPRPVQQPHPPIWIGGNSRRALRRAVELGDGWMPFPNPAATAARRKTPELITIEQLAARLDEAHELEAQHGRTLRDVMFTPVGVDAFGTTGWDAAAFRQVVAEYAAIGVTMCAVHIPAGSLVEYCDLLGAFGAEILS